MNAGSVLVAAGILGGLGLGFGLLIAVVNRRFWVWVDPRIEAVTGMLPGSNCGACGEAGCRVFAEKLIDGAREPAMCTSLSAGDIDAVADYLGVEAGESVKRVARLLCAGGCDVAAQQAEYRGLETCAAAATVAGGGKACAWGCLGHGDCVAVCDFDAMFMNAARIPVVIPDPCTACGDCVEACPLDLLTLMPVDHKLIVQCRNEIMGEAAEAMCSVACNGCGKCVADAAPGLIEMVGGLAVIDYTKIELAAPAAVARCPTGAIAWVEGAQFTDVPGAARVDAA